MLLYSIEHTIALILQNKLFKRLALNYDFMITIGIIDFQNTYGKGLALTLCENDNYKVVLIVNSFEMLKDKMNMPGMKPDIFFVAIHSPEVTGWISARWLHKNFPDIKLIAISSVIKYMEVSEMFDNGCIAFFSKWISETLMRSSVQEIADNRFHSKLDECIDEASFRKVTHFHGVSIPKLNDLDKLFGKWFVTSMTDKQIAIKMGITEFDVVHHKRTYYKELDVHNRPAMILKLQELGYEAPPPPEGGI